MQDVIIVGGGLAGLACARDLARSGRSVLVLDKSRGLGGRAATRRLGNVRVDHGAQYFTARGERLGSLTAGWLDEGFAVEWTRGFPVWEDGTVHVRPDGHPRFAIPNGMSSLGRKFARDLPVLGESVVTSVSRADEGWRVLTAGGDVFEARTVLFDLPAPQLAPILEDVNLGEPGDDLARVRFDPTWTLIAPLRADLAVPWKALEVRHDVLAWLARDHTKREPGAPPVLVAHANAAWSRVHLEAERDAVKDALLAAVREVAGPIEVQDAASHRWRFATPTRLYPHAHHFDASLSLGWCGDWCVAPKVEGALESGWSLAGVVTAHYESNRTSTSSPTFTT